MEIILPEPKEIIIREAEKVTTDKILVNEFTDTGSSVSALITIEDVAENQNKRLILWDGQAYLDAGQYTDEDIINRIKELL